MAKKKKKTLPKNFREMIEAGDVAALKAVYNDCELNAYGTFDKGTALHFYDVPDELVRYLVEQGLDIDTPTAVYKRTPLEEHATVGNNKLVKLLLNLGADINGVNGYDCDTPLHAAAGYHRAETVRLLIERGANIHAKNSSKQTPLAYALARCQNINIADMAVIARLLLNAGAEITPQMTESVKRIGKEFEFHRSNFNKKYLAETDEGLAQLYALFGAEAAAKRQMHDGVSPITVTAATWQKRHQQLWEMLIPSSGVAKTVQGEVIRITGRVSDELYRNGGANWNADYRKMLNALLKYFATQTPLSPEELAEAKAMASSIKADGSDDGIATDRLGELAVKWVLLNPNPIPLGAVEYGR